MHAIVWIIYESQQLKLQTDDAQLRRQIIAGIPYVLPFSSSAGRKKHKTMLCSHQQSDLNARLADNSFISIKTLFFRAAPGQDELRN